ncbi:hypothetical protein KWA75_004582 [Salmonella enterica]|uniref:hypothetical protein n=1 Tax=Salmonella enterica TaxID=28901 RepID=UPI0015916AA8|nr:hypothetical protein [Salmonella enterica]EDR6330936.1 hypothetical protein [Salmonella enterica subsp. enterica serovar Hillingdon]EDR9797597.1 hypothetical protein [Salmonella enterica subsp. enterica serovar Zongo]EHO4927643.1 hypothetical protein [Salmonella enterica subsp. enterica serovar Corvallis]EIP0099779.1 hypothetical protein [Salmonella enterica subsp. enterica serovar Wangata]EHS6173042.1 hypothetical protein [Salmonella enterica]
MSELRLLEIIRLNGRYEVINQDGQFIVRPLGEDEIIISPRSHQECVKRFGNPAN